jgi:hypothetical protein
VFRKGVMKLRRTISFKKVLFFLGFMSAFLLVLSGTPFAVQKDFVGSTLETSGDRDTSRGILQFFPVPDLTICFCGSYRLTVSEEKYKAYYLLSDRIDFSQFIGKNITVSGKIYSAPCEGTLFYLCPFLIVDEIQENIPAASEDDTWGTIKALYGN